MCMNSHEPKTLPIWSERIRHFRRVQRLSQEVVAARAGVGIVTLSTLERGGNPTTDTLAKVAHVLGVTVEMLFTNPTTPYHVFAFTVDANNRIVNAINTNEPGAILKSTAILGKKLEDLLPSYRSANPRSPDAAAALVRALATTKLTSHPTAFTYELEFPRAVWQITGTALTAAVPGLHCVVATVLKVKR